MLNAVAGAGCVGLAVVSALWTPPENSEIANCALWYSGDLRVRGLIWLHD